MKPTSRPPPDFESVDFETIDEHWNEYELQNHTKVRGKYIVIRFARDRNNPKPNAIHMSGQNIFSVDAPPEQRGIPTPLTPEEIKRHGGTRVDVLHSDEKWNKYRIIPTGVVVKVKLVLDEVYRVEGRYDNDGMPAYVITSSPLVLPDKSADKNIRT